MYPLIFQGPKGKQGKAGAPGRRGIQVSGPQLFACPPHPLPSPEALTSFLFTPRACRGSRGLGAWWGDRAPRVLLEQMGFLIVMVKLDSR